MHSTAEFQEKVKQIFSQIDLDAEPRELYEPISYTLGLGGKRIRPLLLLMACDMFGGDLNDALNPAIGFEIFHNFTLLHDDIMDQSPIRRGKETVYKKWNTNIAILSGDAMFALAYKYLIKTNEKVLPSLLTVFNQTALEVCEGQQFDMNYETMEKVSIGDYIKMIRLKTAVLLAGSLKAGAIIGGADSTDADHLYSFGENIGLAFQLKDDLLDVFGDEAVFGKRTGSDIVCNKKTFLYLKAFELAKGETLKQLEELFSSVGTDNETKIRKIKNIYSELGVEHFAEEAMDNYHSNALTHLQTIKVGTEQKQALTEFSTQLMKREK
jgi:geranylgeranyl diphosphate synthase type II